MQPIQDGFPEETTRNESLKLGTFWKHSIDIWSKEYVDLLKKRYQLIKNMVTDVKFLRVPGSQS